MSDERFSSGRGGSLQSRKRSGGAFDLLEEVAGLEKVTSPQPDFLPIEGLDQKVVGAEQKGAVTSDISIVGREHDHGKKPATLSRGPKAPKDLESVGVGHVKVQNHQVGRELDEGLLGGLGIRQANDLIGDVDEELPEQLDIGRLIVDDEDPLAHRQQSLH